VTHRYFKDSDTLKTFFNDERLITVTNVVKYFQSHGVFLFPVERQGIPEFATHLLLGYDSLKKLIRFINAEPLAVSGFVVCRERAETLFLEDEQLWSLLDRSRDKELTPKERATLVTLVSLEDGSIEGTVRYYRSSVGIDLVPEMEMVAEHVDFKALPFSTDHWVVLVVIKKARDYRVVLDVFNRAFQEGFYWRWWTETRSLEELDSAQERHDVLQTFIDALSNSFTILGILGVAGKRDPTLTPNRIFDAVKDIRVATLSQIYPLTDALAAVKVEGAYAKGLELVCVLDDLLLVAEVKGKESRFDVTLSQKKLLGDTDAAQMSTVENIKNLPNAYLDEARERELISRVWLSLYSELNRAIGRAN
jgi:hypothetical protein